MDDEEQVLEPEILTEEEILEDIKRKREAEPTRFSDILTMQCILCLILVISMIVLNMLIPKLSKQLIQQYRMESVSDSGANDALEVLVTKLSDFVNSTPSDRA